MVLGGCPPDRRRFLYRHALDAAQSGNSNLRGVTSFIRAHRRRPCAHCYRPCAHCRRSDLRERLAENCPQARGTSGSRWRPGLTRLAHPSFGRVGSHEPKLARFVSGLDWQAGSLFRFECFLHLPGKPERFKDISAVHLVVIVVVLILAVLIVVEVLQGGDI